MLPNAHHLGGEGKRALPLTRPFARSCDFGRRSCSKIMKSLLKVEAAESNPATARRIVRCRGGIAQKSVFCRGEARRARSHRALGSIDSPWPGPRRWPDGTE